MSQCQCWNEDIKSLQDVCNETCADVEINNCPYLKSLKGISKIATRLYLSKLKSLSSLKGLNDKNPKYINDIELENLKIKNLDYLPEHVEFLTLKNFPIMSTLSSNSCKKVDNLNLTQCKKITNLKGCPEITKSLFINYCNQLTSLEYLNYDENNYLEIDIRNCEKLTSLKGLPRVVKEFNFYSIEDIDDLSDLPDVIISIVRLSSNISEQILKTILRDFDSFETLYKKIVNWNFSSQNSFFGNSNIKTLFIKLYSFHKCKKQNPTEEDLKSFFKFLQFSNFNP